jgi:hypothetical protein
MSDRRDSLLRACPDIFSYKTVLYIGANADRYDFIMDSLSEPGEGFVENGYIIDVLEMELDNVKHLQTLSYLNEVIHGDVRTFKTNKKYDIVFWWHGPEHINAEEIPPALENLEKIAKVAVILGCPWGFHDRPDHLCHNQPELFQSLGYITDTSGDEKILGCNISSVKYIKGK